MKQDIFSDISLAELRFLDRQANDNARRKGLRAAEVLAVILIACASAYGFLWALFSAADRVFAWWLS